MAATVRRAVAADLGGLLDRYAQLNPADAPLAPDHAADIWRRILANPDVSVFVVDIDGRPVSTCMLSITPGLTRCGRPFAVIEDVVTDSRHRQRGYGRAALDAAVAAA